MDILIKPLISEKTVKLADELNQYTFVVKGSANKINVSKAISEKFSVKVENIRIINILGKQVVFGKERRKGRKSTVKKAIATLKEGDSIGIFKLQ